MAYRRMDAAQSVPAYIVFYYKTDDLFNNVFLKTTYRAKSLRDKNDEAQVDEYAMSEDEKDAFTLFLQQAIHDVFNSVMKMTSQVTDALILDTSVAAIISDVSAEDDKAYGFKIKDHEAYNANNLVLVDDGAKKMIENYILKEWYKMVGLDSELQKHLAEYMASRQDLVTKRLFQLRKPFIN